MFNILDEILLVIGKIILLACGSFVLYLLYLVVTNEYNKDSEPTIEIPANINIAFKPDKYSEEDIICLTDNIYHEARYGDAPIEEWVAIAEVVMNRIEIDRFPSTICEVIYDEYQFSWSSKPNTINEYDRYMLANMFVKDFLDNYDAECQTRLSFDHYYAHGKVKPKWSSAALESKIIGKHTFIKLEK